MKSFCIFAVLFFAVALRVFAQDSADSEYIFIYSDIEQADQQQSAGNLHDALEDYLRAQTELQKFQRVYPQWNPKIVNFRLNYIADKIAGLTPQVSAQMPATNSAPQAAAKTTNDNSSQMANWQAQLNSLQEQLSQSQSDNTTLAAKLKEALAAQPAATDPRELAKAQEQIRELMKENDLLKASVGTGGEPESVGPTNAFADLKNELAAANKKLTEALARSDALTKENQALQSRIQAMLASPAAAEALREENELLKKQVAELRAATNSSSAAIASLRLQLSDARGQIAMLKSNAEIISLEKLALQDRVKQLQSAAPSSADQKANEERIKSLTNERDDLLAKLDAANKKIYGGKKEDAIAKVEQLTDEVNRLRARLDIADAQPVPYTPEEAALFKPAPKLAANPEAEKKALSEMPENSAALVAEAQRHFSSGNFSAAEDDYQKILEHDQNNGLALANLAMIELQQNKLADAQKHITAALAQSPNDAYNLLVLGQVKFNEQKFDDALDALGRAAKIDPQNPEIENVIGATLAQKGLRNQAETAFRKAIELDPHYGSAHKNLAVVYLSQTPPMIALAKWHYQKALDAGVPRSPELEKMFADKGSPVSAE
ncbi:MAG TPA: tetratricopeptide repeat protein [Verrucomicrobiae bacterium]|nr:tetratricopeptide repeat protein [Verrucomicrobiae bacterium]